MKGKLYQSVDELPSGYDSLLRAAATANFYFSAPWYRNVTQTTLDDGDQLVLIGVENDDGRGGARALMVARRRMAPPLKPRSLDLFVNAYTMIAGPVLHPEETDGDAVIAMLIRTIREQLPDIDIVRLESMDPDTASFAALKKGLAENGFLTRDMFSFVNWHEPCADISYEDYVASLTGKMRNLIRRRSRKLEREHDVRWTLTDGSDGFDEAMEAYWKVYDASWKIPESYPNFINGFVRACREAGVLRLGILYVDGEAAAAQIWTVTGSEATIYKLAYDEKFKALSVGSVLTAKIMQNVIEVDKPRTIDFGYGNDPYKKDWTRHRRDRMGLIGFRIDRPFGAFAAAKFLTRRFASKVRDRLRDT